MLGAIIGDMVGSIYEFNPIKSKNFDIYDKRMTMTDDSLLTLAVTKVLMNNYPINFSEESLNSIKDQLISYKKKIDILGDTNNNDIKCELIPTSKEEMNILKDEDLKNLLFSVGFY